jgi:uncharacterized membrane protein YdjX (TVP38/TMEM64 family)
MKTYNKIIASIALISLVLIFLSFPASPIATLGKYIFGSYKTYLFALTGFFGASVTMGAIIFIWKEL